MIAVDAMGGDFAPKAACEGAVLACRKRPELEVALVGDAKQIDPFFANVEQSVRSRLHVIHASEVIKGDDHPSASIRKKKDSSLVVALTALKEKNVDAVVSAGNTGAVTAGGVLILGRIEGIDRPALGIVFPSLKSPTLLLDVGANVRCKPLNLYQFAVMGHLYAQLFSHIKNPSVKLLNIGSEDIKGDETILEARGLIEHDGKLNYQGFAEANEIAEGAADVIVCDGFTGNVTIKFAEGLVDLLRKEFKKDFMSKLMPKVGLVFMFSAIKKFANRIEWQKIGHAPLLGVNGTVIKCHGRSQNGEICYAILGADDFVKADGIGKIKAAIAEETF